MTTVKLGLGLPKKTIVTHKYRETIKITSTTGVLFTQFFSCNGLYDPNITGTGHQPLYFDQMSALYNHYTVIGAKISCKITSATATVGPQQCVLLQTDDTTYTGTGTPDGIGEQSLGVQTILPLGATRNAYLSRKWSAKKTFGGSVLGNDNLQGTSASNPVEQSYFMFGMATMDGSTTSSVFVEFDISYIAIWDELKDVTQS